MIERVVDTREYVSVLREIAEEGRVVSLKIAGSSMSPFLAHGRDYIYFTRPDRELKRGDMVFYQRDSDQIFALITKVKRKGSILQPGDFWWEFFEHIWIRIVPLRRLAVGMYSAFCKLVHRGKTTENH